MQRATGNPDTATTMGAEERTLEPIHKNRRITDEEVAGKLLMMM